jgi:hypothetical protein
MTKYKFFKIPIYFYLGLLFCTQISAQYIKTVQDFETWSSVGLEYEPIDGLNLELQEQVRLNKNSQNLDQYFTQLSMSYNLSKHFEISGGYRWITSNEKDNGVSVNESSNRYHLGILYKHAIKRTTFSYRLRFQNKSFLDAKSSSNQFLRFKTRVKYNIKNWKLDPIASAELYREIDGEFSKFRATLATDYRFKKIGKIKVFFRFIKELNEPNPKSSTVVGLSFIHKLKF